jgi:hypothetical protein
VTEPQFQNLIQISPSELMIETLEKFGSMEPEHALVIYISKDGHIAYNSTGTSVALKLGLMDFVREMLMRRAFEPENQ